MHDVGDADAIEDVIEERNVEIQNIMCSEIANVDLDDNALDLQGSAIEKVVDDGMTCKCIIVGRIQSLLGK
jgi:hypothetical protein